jgi:hypothetical protein
MSGQISQKRVTIPQPEAVKTLSINTLMTIAPLFFVPLTNHGGLIHKEILLRAALFKAALFLAQQLNNLIQLLNNKHAKNYKPYC